MLILVLEIDCVCEDEFIILKLLFVRLLVELDRIVAELSGDGEEGEALLFPSSELLLFSEANPPFKRRCRLIFLETILIRDGVCDCEFD